MVTVHITVHSNPNLDFHIVSSPNPTIPLPLWKPYILYQKQNIAIASILAESIYHFSQSEAPSCLCNFRLLDYFILFYILNVLVDEGFCGSLCIFTPCMYLNFESHCIYC